MGAEAPRSSRTSGCAQILDKQCDKQEALAYAVQGIFKASQDDAASEAPNASPTVPALMQAVVDRLLRDVRTTDSQLRHDIAAQLSKVAAKAEGALLPEQTSHVPLSPRRPLAAALAAVLAARSTSASRSAPSFDYCRPVAVPRQWLPEL